MAIGEEGEMLVVPANPTATGAVRAKLTIMNYGGSQALAGCFSDEDVTLLT
jgi:hypothetical protein